MQMAQSRSGRSSGKSSSSSRSSGSSSGGRRPSSGAGNSSRSSASAAARKVSSRARRRQERNSVMGSIPLAAIGILAIALVVVPGQSAWYVVRSGMFGLFGIMTYLVGPLLINLAYLMASGYRISRFVIKSVLLAFVCASVPVVFSDFKVGDSNFFQVVQSLFSWGQTRFWSGGIMGGLIGASLVALCGRPASNFVMLLLFATGLMVFFAVTPRDVVQFFAYQSARVKQARNESRARENEYDTPLFSGEPEEEPIENLTGTLPEDPQSVPHHPAFNVEPYLERDAARMARRRAEEQQPGVQPAAAPQASTYTEPVQETTRREPVRPVMPVQNARPSFDVDLGPDMSERALHEAIEHDPLQPVEIGPGGTFGLDPLRHLGQPATYQQPVAVPKPSALEPRPEPEPEEDFSLHLEQPQKQDTADTGDLDDLIRKAMAGIPEEADENHVGEIHLDVSAQNTVAPEPEPEISPTVSRPEASGTRDVIPTLGGSFDAARDAWNAGMPIGAVLSGRAAAP